MQVEVARRQCERVEVTHRVKNELLFRFGKDYLLYVDLCARGRGAEVGQEGVERESVGEDGMQRESVVSGWGIREKQGT